MLLVVIELVALNDRLGDTRPGLVPLEESE